MNLLIALKSRSTWKLHITRVESFEFVRDKCKCDEQNFSLCPDI